jgi:transposase
VRSERQFCARLNYDLMFRYFLDMLRCVDLREEQGATAEG